MKKIIYILFVTTIMLVGCNNIKDETKVPASGGGYRVSMQDYKSMYESLTDEREKECLKEQIKKVLKENDLDISDSEMQEFIDNEINN